MMLIKIYHIADYHKEKTMMIKIVTIVKKKGYDDATVVDNKLIYLVLGTPSKTNKKPQTMKMTMMMMMTLTMNEL